MLTAACSGDDDDVSGPPPTATAAETEPTVANTPTTGAGTPTEPATAPPTPGEPSDAESLFQALKENPPPEGNLPDIGAEIALVASPANDDSQWDPDSGVGGTQLYAASPAPGTGFTMGFFVTPDEATAASADTIEAFLNFATGLLEGVDTENAVEAESTADYTACAPGLDGEVPYVVCRARTDEVTLFVQSQLIDLPEGETNATIAVQLVDYAVAYIDSVRAGLG